MHKHTTDYTKPCLNDLERAAAISENAIIPDTKGFRESLMEAAAISENARMFDTKGFRESLIHAAAISENARIFDTKGFRESLIHAAAISENARMFDTKGFRESLIHAAAISENTIIPDTKGFRESLRHAAAISENARMFDTKGFRESLIHAAAISENVKEHRDNYVETDYNRDLDYRVKEEPNHPIEDYNEGITANLEGIFEDGSVISPGNQKISSNTTYIEQINITFNIEQMIQGEKIEMKSEVSTNGQVGVLNTGKMQAKSMTTSITTLADPSQHQIAEALTSLTEAVKASQNISSQQQIEILEQLELLSKQATLAPSERKAGLIKPILSTLATTFSAGGGLAEIWSQWGDVIKNFFGFHE